MPNPVSDRESPTPRWVLTFDVGGTFTDLILVDCDSGTTHATKVPTTPADMSRGISEGVTRLLEGTAPDDVPVAFRGATTLVGNLLHERKGCRVALLVTKGFRDLLTIRREYRYDLYDLCLRFPEPLVAHADIHEVEERLAADGTPITPPREEQLGALAAMLRDDGIESIAVCFLHAYGDDRHERQIETWLRAGGYHGPVTTSGSLVPEAREYERASTTVANAYVLPRMRDQIEHTGKVLAATGHPGDLHLMFSNGGFSSLEHALTEPIQLVESGPAAGVVAAGRLRTVLGIDRLLTFEMGGTTAKMSLLRSDQPDIVTESEVARTSRFRRGSGIPLKIRAVDLLEIGAGGGSIATVSDGRLLVGPQSAGADPGPACYGWGGTHATVTDADAVLGYLNPEYFLGGRMILDVEAAREALDRNVATPLGMSVLEAARAVRTIADENLAVATRVHFAEKGADPRQYTLAAFGGAGPTHWDTIVERLDIPRVVIPEFPGVGSAVGLAVAPLAVHLVRTFFTGLGHLDWSRLNDLYDDMEAEARRLLTDAGADESAVRIQRTADMRYVGQGYEISVGLPDHVLGDADRDGIVHEFTDEYRRLFGRDVPGVSLEALAWRIAACAPPSVSVTGATRASSRDGAAEAEKRTRRVYVAKDTFVDAAVYDRMRVQPGRRVAGPAILEEPESTIWVPPMGTAWVGEEGHVVIDLEGAST